MHNYQQQNFLEDYLRALQQPINKLNNLTKQQFKSLQQTFDINFSKKMSIIIQEAEPQAQDNQSSLINIRRNFNNQIKHLFKIKEELQEILNHYKRQLQKLAMDYVRNEQIRKNLQQKLNESLKNSRKKSKQKDERQLNRSRKVYKQKDFEKQKYKISQKQFKNNPIQDQLQIRKPPSPLKQNSCLNCVKLQEDKNRWKVLANKIEQFKKKNNSFEQQLKSKQQQILNLKQNIIELQKKLKDNQDQKQKKNLKKDNTTLRGQKVLMTNQLNLLKKQLNQKTQLAEIQELQIKKLRLEIENINSSLSWHINNLNEMRSSQNKSMSKQQKDQIQKIQLLNNYNMKMFQIIVEQQKRMQDINSKTKKIESGFQNQIDRYIKRINQLENMLEDKNQTIIRLKTNGVGLKSDKNANYQSQMIKLLNKKLTEKQQKIRSLQISLQEKGSDSINQQCL